MLEESSQKEHNTKEVLKNSIEKFRRIKNELKHLNFKKIEKDISKGFGIEI